MMKVNLLLWRPWEDRGSLKRCKTEKPTRRQKAKKAEWVTPFSHVHIFLHSTVCFRVPDSCFPQFARSPFLIVSASYNNGELIFKSLQLSPNKKSSGQYHTLWTKQKDQKSNYGCVLRERRLPEFIINFQNARSTNKKSQKGPREVLGRSCWKRICLMVHCTQQTGDDDGNPFYICSLWCKTACILLDYTHWRHTMALV